MVKAFIFDADGVVVNKPVLFSQHFSQKHDIPYEQVLPFFQHDFQPCLIGKADLKDVIAPYLQKWHWNKSVDEFLEYWFETENIVDERIVELIKNWQKQGGHCFLATNQEQYRTNFMRDRMGFEKLFDQIFSSAEIGYKKPNAEFFRSVLKVLEDKPYAYRPEQLWFWDDDQDNVKGALETGMKAELYKDFEEFKMKMTKAYELF